MADDIVGRAYDCHVCSPAQNWCRNRPLIEEMALEIQKLRTALKPLADKKVPGKTACNAGAYSFRYDEIRAAQDALAGTHGEG